MAEEDLIEVIVGNAERGKSFRRAGADIEDELVAVAEFDQPAGSGLLRARVRHACATGGDAHFVRAEILGAGKIGISVSCRFDGGNLRI
jgi:hypothetical protein